MLVVANWNAISVSMDVAESPICGPNWAKLIQKTVQDMKTIRQRGTIIFHT